MLPRRALLALVAVAVAALGGLVFTAAMRDTQPPQIYVESQARLPVGAPIELFVSTDEPATLRLEYAGQVVEEVTQQVTFSLPAVAGALTARIVATDGAGNGSETSVLITGVPPLEPSLETASAVRAGDPLGVRVRHGAGGDPLLSAQLADVLVTLDDAVLPTRADGDELLAMAATPMLVEPASSTLTAIVTDEFGRRYQLTQQVALEPLPVEVEQLRLSAATLALVTPEGRDLEAAAVARAWAQAEPLPLWQGAFLTPISGVGTSGFGDARRYEQGGAVSFHYGLDLAAPLGTPVRSTNDGRVLIAGHYPIKGGFVAVDHGAGLMSYYFHLSKILVTEGQLVSAGDVIAEVGSEGLSTGPHLHWEMRVHQRASNPLAWVGRRFPGGAQQ